MAGYLHIFRTGSMEDPDRRKLPEYQVNLTIGRNTYTRTFEEPKLLDFLRAEAALDSDTLTRTIEELRGSGRATIANVEIEEGEAPALGLEQIPSGS